MLMLPDFHLALPIVPSPLCFPLTLIHLLVTKYQWGERTAKKTMYHLGEKEGGVQDFRVCEKMEIIFDR